jgi:hypothetical protein
MALEFKRQQLEECRILCAYSDGTISFSAQDSMIMITVRLDELFEIIAEAGDASQTLNKSMPKEYKDAELEKRWEELSDIPFVDADSPSGMILEQAWWIFEKGTDREDIWRHFDTNHSKGVSYLLYGEQGETNPPPEAGE